MATKPKPRALVIDDEPQILKRFEAAFGRAGYVVETASSLSDAKTLAKVHKFDLAVVDLRLSDGWGIDFVPELRALHPDARIVVLSAFLGIDVTIRAIRAGADDAVEKPIAPSELVKRIEAGPSAKLPGQTPKRTMADVKHEEATKALADAGGNVSEAARRLGVYRTTLLGWLKKGDDED
ncbi:MAG TPA: response regulator [Acidimicrobiia bacterium]|nr:response regulator [Acidimicrobiia bacterium]